MKKSIRNRKGQFAIIAALLVAIVLSTALITTFAVVRNSPFEEPPAVLGAVDEVNANLKRILELAVGYYDSVLQMTGNNSYAKVSTTNYLYSGLVYIMHAHPEWSPSFLNYLFSPYADWFKRSSQTYGNLSVTYSLTGLGISNVHFTTSSKLNVAVAAGNSTSQTRITVTKEDGLPVLTLSKDDFNFYSNYPSGTPLIPTAIGVFRNGTYIVKLPAGITSALFWVKITDPRGLMVIAKYP